MLKVTQQFGGRAEPEARAASITHALCWEGPSSPRPGSGPGEGGLRHRGILLARHARPWPPALPPSFKCPRSCAPSLCLCWRVLRNRQFMHTRQNLKGIKEPNGKPPTPSASHPFFQLPKILPRVRVHPPRSQEPAASLLCARSLGLSHVAWEGAFGPACAPLTDPGLARPGFPRQTCGKFDGAAAVRPAGWKGNS